MATWNKFDWIRRHLKAAVPLEAVPKPPKKGGDDGIVRQNKQAVAMPPEFLMAYEDALERMVAAGDWRRGPVAASLQVAYSLIRVAHLGRSTFKHANKVTYWLEAFRGKGKREGARRAFLWAMIGRGLSGFDVAQVLYLIWKEWSEKVGYPLDYVAMDPDSGVKLESQHIQAVMRSVAKAFMPDPKQAIMIQPYSNRRFGGTLTGITKTPPTDVVAYGGWAGVPELAKVATDATEVLTAWKRSMPHLYSDRRSENEQIQKALHMELLRRLMARLLDLEGYKVPFTWENIERVAMSTGEDGIPVLAAVRTVAMERVADERKDLVDEPLFGAEAERRAQFTVEAIAGGKRSRGGENMGPGSSEGEQIEEQRSTPKPQPKARLPPPRLRPPRAAVSEATSQPVPGEVAAPAVEAQADPVVPVAVSAVRREWVMTMRSKYLHAIQEQEEGIYTACKWRKGAKTRKPIDEERILWRGEAEAARSLRIQICPDPACGL